VRRLAAILALGLLLGAPALAAAPRFTMDEIEREVMCPVCGTRLDLSHSAAANEIRTFVLNRQADGWSKKQVEDALVAQFGPTIMADTPTSGTGLVAWLVPAIAAVGGVGIAAGAVLVWRRRRPSVVAVAAPAELDEESERRVARALADYDA
jgi:cytochrome c-type biogenesis protein CcmH